MHPKVEEFLKEKRQQEAAAKAEAEKKAQEQAALERTKLIKRVANRLSLYDKEYAPENASYSEEYPHYEYDEKTNDTRYYKRVYPELSDEELQLLLPYTDIEEPEETTTYTLTNSIPENIQEILRPNKISVALMRWAEWIKGFGGFLFAVLLIIGIIISILAATSVNEDDAFIAFLTSAITWGLYSAIEYAAYRIISLLFTALASLVRNTQISTDIALLQADKDA